MILARRALACVCLRRWNFIVNIVWVCTLNDTLPYFPIYPGDYLRNAVSGCTLAAQGLWLRMRIIATSSSRIGYLVNGNDAPLTDGTISCRCGIGIDEFLTLRSELITSKSIIQSKNGLLYFPDMVSSKQRSKNHYNTGQRASRLRATRLSVARKKGTHTKAQWELLITEFDGRCVICLNFCKGGPTKDHIVPIYQGGSDGIDNIQPACRNCNSAKHSDSFNWIQYRRENGWKK